MDGIELARRGRVLRVADGQLEVACRSRVAIEDEWLGGWDDTPGIVSVWEPAAGPARGVPYIVFAGNVGDDDAMVAALGALHGI